MKTSSLFTFIKMPIRRLLKSIIKEVENDTGHDIALELQYRALQSTADYIQENMKEVNSVDSNLELLTQSLKKADIGKNNLICEFGVFSGRTINHIAQLVEEPVYGFDSFEGLPERWRDKYDQGHFKVSTLPKVKPNVVLIKGWFDQTLPKFLQEHLEFIGFLHIDCDLYSSTKTIIELCKKRIVSGTVIVFDEYFNYPNWEHGEFKAFQEFINANSLRYQYLGYNRFYEQVAIKIL